LLQVLYVPTKVLNKHQLVGLSTSKREGKWKRRTNLDKIGERERKVKIKCKVKVNEVKEKQRGKGKGRNNREN